MSARIRRLSINRHDQIIVNNQPCGHVSLQHLDFVSSWYGEFIWCGRTYARFASTKEKLLTALRLAATNKPRLVVNNTSTE